MTISKLTVNSLQGELYDLYRKYVEKHGGSWDERRDGDKLLAVNILFPPETIAKPMSPSGNFERHQIILADNAVIFWNHHIVSGQDTITIPYVYL